ncbi:MAG: restriction endonuclease subunit S [Deltaproteobacteria bacterium]|nr:restriction endonuclease subunit S [Deltaproteobacteria bacterium]
MNGAWPLMTLAEAGVTLLDCEHRTPPPADPGYPYVAIPQIKEGRIDLAGVRRITREHFIDWTRRTRPQAHDVVLVRRCNPGDTAVVPPGLDFALGQNLVLLRADGTRVLPRMLRWLVRGPLWWEQIGAFINVGAVFDSLRCGDVPNFRLRIPPLPEQRAIAHILGTLDDKIELGRQMNKTLEDMAQAIFKSWFIDFDGHTDFVESELGPIPRGWEVRRLQELTSKIGSGATPRGGSQVYVDDGINFVRSQNVHDSAFTWSGMVTITAEAAEALRSVTVQTGDVLINITGDSILRTCVAPPDVLPARVNQHVAIVRPIQGVPTHFVHRHLLRPWTKEYLLGHSAGATRKAITKGHLEGIPIAVPRAEKLAQFASTTGPLFEKAVAAEAESRTLAALRDTLLPKLISGELRVPEAEEIVADAT